MDDLRSTIAQFVESVERIVEPDVLAARLCAVVALAWILGVTIALLWRIVEWLSLPRPQPVPESPPPKPREEQIRESLQEITQDLELERDALSSIDFEGPEEYYVENALRRKMMHRLFTLLGIAEEEGESP